MQFSVTAAELIQAANTCTTTNSEIQAQIQRMRSMILDLMGRYSGPTANALLSLSEQWRRDADSLNYVLSTIAQGLTSNAQNYVQHETTNVANMANVASALPRAWF